MQLGKKPKVSQSASCLGMEQSEGQVQGHTKRVLALSPVGASPQPVSIWGTAGTCRVAIQTPKGCFPVQAAAMLMGRCIFATEKLH